MKVRKRDRGLPLISESYIESSGRGNRMTDHPAAFEDRSVHNIQLINEHEV